MRLLRTCVFVWSFEKGGIVLGVSFTRPVYIASGDVIAVDCGPLGAIGVSFE